ncbi:MAG: hypothetical protein ACKESB_00065 [Candidatus Hodgkinia cicadicola]
MDTVGREKKHNTATYICLTYCGSDDMHSAAGRANDESWVSS